MNVAALELDGMTVPVDLGGTSRRAKLTIERDGSLRLRAAADIEQGELERFLTSKRDWIYRRLAEKEVLQYEPVTKELVDGEGLLYLGRSHRLRIVDTDERRVVLHRGRLVLPRSRLADGCQALNEWYVKCGMAWLKPVIKEWAMRLRVAPEALDVSDLGHRWGAATATGRVRIHWATMQLSPPLVHYVVAHELAHLHEPHHGPAFWQLLSRAMPDCHDRKNELARRGATVWLGAVSAVRDG